MQGAERGVIPFPDRVSRPADFSAFFAEEHRKLFKALYFVTGNRADAAELMQDAFLKLWERWDTIDQIDDPTATCSAWRSTGSGCERAPHAAPRGGWWPPTRRRPVRRDRSPRGRPAPCLLELTPRQRAALVLLDLYGYGSEEAARIMGIRPSTVRALATQGRAVLRTSRRSA